MFSLKPGLSRFRKLFGGQAAGAPVGVASPGSAQALGVLGPGFRVGPEAGMQSSSPLAFRPDFVEQNGVALDCLEFLVGQISRAMPSIVDAKGDLVATLDDPKNIGFLKVLQYPIQSTTWSRELEKIIRAAYGSGFVPVRIIDDEGSRPGFQIFPWIGWFFFGPGNYACGGEKYTDKEIEMLMWRHHPGCLWLPISPLEGVSNELQLYNVTTANAYGRMSAPAPGLKVSMPTSSDQVPLTPQQQEAVRSQVEATAGLGAGGAYIDRTNIPLTELSGSHQRFTFDSQWEHCEAAICSAFGLPTAVIGLKGGTSETHSNASMESWVRVAWDGGIASCVSRIERWFNEQLIPRIDPETTRRGYQFKFQTEGLIPMSEVELEARERRLHALHDKGLITNEELVELIKRSW